MGTSSQLPINDLLVPESHLPTHRDSHGIYIWIGRLLWMWAMIFTLTCSTVTSSIQTGFYIVVVMLKIFTVFALVSLIRPPRLIWFMLYWYIESTTWASSLPYIHWLSFLGHHPPIHELSGQWTGHVRMFLVCALVLKESNSLMYLSNIIQYCE